MKPDRFGNRAMLDKMDEAEPFFILRGQDAFSAALVKQWADLAEGAGTDPAKGSKRSRMRARHAQLAHQENPRLMADHLYLVDGSSFIFRAYHAYAPSQRADGTPINAVLGFCTMLMGLLRDRVPPTHLAVIFDRSEPTFRKAMYPAYKAQRPPPPADLVPQFPLIRDAVRAFGIPCIEKAGFEADDLIATYCGHAREREATVTIVSADKDLMQLVSRHVVMLDTMRDKTIDREAVFEKFGVWPRLLADVLALVGDPVDNIPGAPGIGVKIGAQLITEYGSLEGLLKRAGEVKKPARRNALIDGADQIRLSRRLIELDHAVALDVPYDDLVLREPADGAMLEFFTAMGFSSLARRVREAA